MANDRKYLNVMASSQVLMLSYTCCFVVSAIWGGHPAPHAAAQEDAWKKMLDFIEDNLRR